MNALTPISYAQFAAWVQDALNHLYDSLHLQAHPLAGLLAEPALTRVQRGQQLRRLLINAILSMSPQSGTPAQSPDWRAYRILELHFIEGQTPAQVMKALGLGRTLYFKEKARMVEGLTRALWERRTELFAMDMACGEGFNYDIEELASIRARIEHLNLGQVLEELCTMLLPLVQAKGRTLVCAPAADLCVQADRVLLRQAILDIIGHMLETLEASALTLTGFADAQLRGVRISPWSATLTESALALARQLMGLMGGEVMTEANEVRLAWPIEGAPIRTLLVIDDNAGLIQLFRRYLTGHAWQVVGAADLGEALTAVDEIAPDAVVLDVMLPKQDGWEALRALKSHERTRHTPVIICSVMHQPELASQLGAAGYLKKPVTQAQLLQALASLS